MKIVCDACQAKYSIADDKIQGKSFKIRCKKCNHIIVVKTGGESGAVASAAEKAKSGPVAAAPVATQGVWPYRGRWRSGRSARGCRGRGSLAARSNQPGHPGLERRLCRLGEVVDGSRAGGAAGRAAQGEPRRSATRESVRESVRSERRPRWRRRLQMPTTWNPTCLGPRPLSLRQARPTSSRPRWRLPPCQRPWRPLRLRRSVRILSSQASEPLPVAAKSPGKWSGCYESSDRPAQREFGALLAVESLRGTRGANAIRGNPRSVDDDDHGRLRSYRHPLDGRDDTQRRWRSRRAAIDPTTPVGGHCRGRNEVSPRGGIPIGSVLVFEGAIIGRGHNQRVQRGSVIHHGEMNALENAGRQPVGVYAQCTLYTTLSPCPMCSGAIRLYQFRASSSAKMSLPRR